MNADKFYNTILKKATTDPSIKDPALYIKLQLRKWKKEKLSEEGEAFNDNRHNSKCNEDI